ncbi:hypothetical protein BBAD15_g10979 [Beauveria bassiana D1-5]|uniref:DUF7924 domain-containing protein n=1 Tax=Beauveria bassiana D1-5 TaxID=1245745 RepID=A0A0A2V8G0_BEABA|nr:hypothetical protein BBAD15_g10979 [Beauveria bassiana D1-5]
MNKRAAPSTESLEAGCRPRKQIKYKKRRGNFSPKFYDDLSKVWLTPRALRELDRRNAARPPLASRPPVSASSSPSTTVAQFARHGGPSLCHLRGCIDSKGTTQIPTSKSWSYTPDSKMSKRTSAYDTKFEQGLAEYNIFTDYYHLRRCRRGYSTPEPENLDDIVQALSKSRDSQSPTRDLSAEFQKLKRANSRVITHACTRSALLPVIKSNSKEHDGEYGLRFKRLDSITKRTTVDPAPDLYDGSYPSSLHKSVQQDLGDVITPTHHYNAPVLPNFFLEIRAPEKCFEVVKRQACLDGAVGARAMHALQNYGAEKPVYDGNAYSFSFVYHAGTATLHMYAHFPTAPQNEGGAPEYQMKQVDAFFMTKNREDFVAAVTTFRNARDMAESYRERFIEAANVRAEGKSQPLAEGREELQ